MALWKIYMYAYQKSTFKQKLNFFNFYLQNRKKKKID